MDGSKSALHILSGPDKTLVQINGEDCFNNLVLASEVYTIARVKWIVSISLTLAGVSFALLLTLLSAEPQSILRTLCVMLITYSMSSLWFLGKYRGLYTRARKAWLEREKVGESPEL